MTAGNGPSTVGLELIRTTFDLVSICKNFPFLYLVVTQESKQNSGSSKSKSKSDSTAKLLISSFKLRDCILTFLAVDSRQLSVNPWPS